MPNDEHHEKEMGESSHANLLESFLGSVENLVEQISAISTEAVPKGEYRILTQSTGELLTEQTKKLTAFIRESSTHLSSMQRSELDGFLRVQAGEAIARRGVSVMQQSIAAGVASGGIFSWISFILHEIKKIIDAILSLLNVSDTVLRWVHTIELLIDEILNDLLKFLGLGLGLDGAHIARVLSQEEVQYLAEMTALETWNSARLKIPSQKEE